MAAEGSAACCRPSRWPTADAALASFADRITPFIWDKMYRAKAIGDLRFAEDIHRAEDGVYRIEAHARANRVVFSTGAQRYYVSTGSLTSTRPAARRK